MLWASDLKIAIGLGRWVPGVFFQNPSQIMVHMVLILLQYLRSSVKGLGPAVLSTM